MRMLLLFLILCMGVQTKGAITLTGSISSYETKESQVVQVFRPVNAVPQSWYAAKEDDILINSNGTFIKELNAASEGVYILKMPDSKTILLYISSSTSSVSLNFKQENNIFILINIEGSNGKGNWLAYEMRGDLARKISTKNSDLDPPSFWAKINVIETAYNKRIDSLAAQAMIDEKCRSFLQKSLNVTVLNSIYYYTQSLFFSKGPEKQYAQPIIDSAYKRYRPLNPAYLQTPLALNNAFKYARYINETKDKVEKEITSVDDAWSAIATDYSVPSQLPEPYREAQLGDFILINYFFVHSPESKKAIQLFYKQYPYSGYMPVFIEALTSEKSEQQKDISYQTGSRKVPPAETGIDFIQDSIGLSGLIKKHFKGKMVLVDCWATWCKYCIVEFPAYQQYDSFMKENNIIKLFVSFDKTPTDKLWQPMVLNRKIEGQHVIVNDKIEKDIYSITKIKQGEPLPLPRYILIGPDGKVISNDFARPSSKEFFTQLKIYTSRYKH